MTDRGCVYPKNEDSMVVRPDLGLFAVADGMSLPEAGDIASFIAARTIERAFERNRKNHASAATSVQNEGRRLVRSIQRAHARIRITAARRPSRAQIGTTVAAMVLAGDGVALAHVGDSRIYRVRDGYAEQLTVDHSVAHDEVWRSWFPGDPDLRDPKLARMLTQALGAQRRLRIATRIEDIEPGDAYLLTTDGMHEMVSDSEMRAIVQDERGLRAAMIKRSKDADATATVHLQCQWLVQRAKSRGGYDNLTVIVLRFPQGLQASTGRVRTKKGTGYVVHAFDPGAFMPAPADDPEDDADE